MGNKLIPKKQTAGNIEYIPPSKTGEPYYAKDRYGKPVLDSEGNYIYGATQAEANAKKYEHLPFILKLTSGNIFNNSFITLEDLVDAYLLSAHKSLSLDDYKIPEGGYTLDDIKRLTALTNAHALRYQLSPEKQKLILETMGWTDELLQLFNNEMYESMFTPVSVDLLGSNRGINGSMLVYFNNNKLHNKQLTFNTHTKDTSTPEGVARVLFHELTHGRTYNSSGKKWQLSLFPRTTELVLKNKELGDTTLVTKNYYSKFKDMKEKNLSIDLYLNANNDSKATKELLKSGKKYFDYLNEPNELMTRGLEYLFFDKYLNIPEFKNQLQDVWTPESIDKYSKLVVGVPDLIGVNNNIT